VLEQQAAARESAKRAAQADKTARTCAARAAERRALAKANLESAVDKAAAMVAVGADDMVDPMSRSRHSMISNVGSEFSLSRSEMFADQIDDARGKAQARIERIKNRALLDDGEEDSDASSMGSGYSTMLSRISKSMGTFTDEGTSVFTIGATVKSEDIHQYETTKELLGILDDLDLITGDVTDGGAKAIEDADRELDAEAASAKDMMLEMQQAQAKAERESEKYIANSISAARFFAFCFRSALVSRALPSQVPIWQKL
jgi:hypothetical protein